MPKRRGVTTLLPPTHVVEVGDVPRKGQHPKRRQQPGERADNRHPPDFAPPNPQQQQHEQRDEREKSREQMKQTCQSQQHRGHAAVPATAQSPHREPDEQQSSRQSEAVGELTSHRGHQISAVDIERPIENKRQGHQRQQCRTRIC